MEQLSPEHQTELYRIARLARRLMRELIISVLPALLIALFINVFVAEATLVDGPSMQPNLYSGYRVMTDKISYKLHPPQRGDVVVVERPAPEGTLVKRVVALPGETIQVRGGHTFIDGLAIEEPWVSNFGGPDYLPACVPPDHVFILGDNRIISRDSRAIGPVPISAIKRQARLVYWPLDQIKLLP